MSILFDAYVGVNAPPPIHDRSVPVEEAANHVVAKRLDVPQGYSADRGRVPALRAKFWKVVTLIASEPE